MAINTAAITSLYDSLLTAMTAKYDAMWAANEIDAETYAQLVGQASSQLVGLSAELVQKQEGLEADNALKAKQLLVLEEEIKLKKSEADAAYVKMLATIDKEMGYSYTLDANEDVIRSSLADTADGVIDYEREFKQVQAENMYTDRVLKDKQTAKLGLDNVMKLAEASRNADVNYVYTPSYTKGV